MKIPEKPYLKRKQVDRSAPGFESADNWISQQQLYEFLTGVMWPVKVTWRLRAQLKKALEIDAEVDADVSIPLEMKLREKYQRTDVWQRTEFSVQPDKRSNRDRVMRMVYRAPKTGHDGPRK